MKICYIGDPISIHLQRWAKWFADRGHEVHVVTYHPYEFSNSNIHVHEVKMSWFDLNYLPYRSMWAQLRKFRRIIKEINPDIVHGHYITSYGLHTAFAGNYPKVLSAWGSDIFRAPDNSKIIRFVAKYAMKNSNITTTTSKYARNYIVKNFGIPREKIVAFAWGIDLNIFHRNYSNQVKELKRKLDIDEDAKIIFSPRGIREIYGNQYLIESIPQIIEKHPNVVFIILRGSQMSIIKKQIQSRIGKLKIEKNVIFISKYLNSIELATYMNMSDILISIPKSDQFSGVLAEGMACGAVPTVSDLEVYKEHLTGGENAFFVYRENPDSIANAINYFLEHQEIKEKFYRINKKIIEKYFDKDKCMPKMEKLYEELIAEHRR